MVWLSASAFSSVTWYGAMGCLRESLLPGRRAMAGIQCFERWKSKSSNQVEMRGHTGSPTFLSGMCPKDLCFNAIILNTFPHNVLSNISKYTYITHPTYNTWKLKTTFQLCLAFLTMLLLFIYLFIYLWLCWVFVSVCGPSPVVASGGHSSLRCAGLPPSRPLPLRSTGSRRAGSVVVAHGLSRSRACGIPPRPGLEPASPALAGSFSTTAPPGKPLCYFFM